jgi:hypothetical protein
MTLLFVKHGRKLRRLVLSRLSVFESNVFASGLIPHEVDVLGFS